MNIVPRHFRAIWISDLHLGTAGCQAQYLFSFLNTHSADTLYLVGDIVDGWQLRKRWYWPDSHNDVVQRIMRAAREGTRVIYIPGNHDSLARQFAGLSFGHILIERETEHVTADGRRLWVTHGDAFDCVIQNARWIAKLGDALYTVLLKLNRWVNLIRSRLKLPYWSVSQYLKHKAKSAVSFMSDFEDAIAREALERGCDGVVCGHIHKPEICIISGVTYCNCGDWVESLTALTEDFEGKLELVHWRPEG